MKEINRRGCEYEINRFVTGSNFKYRWGRGKKAKWGRYTIYERILLILGRTEDGRGVEVIEENKKNRILEHSIFSQFLEKHLLQETKYVAHP